MSFAGKTVIVTGTSSGIGAAIALFFNREGADVAMVGRNVAKLNLVVDRVAKVGKAPLVIVADLTDEDAARAVIDETIAKYGKLDVLVNNAGGLKPGGILDGERKLLAAYDACMTTNVRSVLQLTALAVPHLAETKGNIVNISSVVSTLNFTGNGFTPYSVSKAALDHFMRCAATELGPLGVRVNNINPGPVVTDFLANADVNVDELSWENIAKTTLLGRVSEPDEVADLALFLASDKARGITGGVYLIDNGVFLKR